MQENDPDTVKLVRPTPDERPLYEQWSEEEQAAASAAAREQPLEGLVTRLEEREAQLMADSTPDETPAPAEPEAAPAGVLATGETVTADDLDGMPWYEARVEVYVRNGPPGDEYGVGGDKIAHTRAATQAPSFNAAAPRLDMQLGEKWQQVLNMAPLADQAPSPDAPVPDPYADLKRNPQYRKVWWLAVGWMTTALLLTIVVVILLAA